MLVRLKDWFRKFILCDTSRRLHGRLSAGLPLIWSMDCVGQFPCTRANMALCAYISLLKIRPVRCPDPSTELSASCPAYRLFQLLQTCSTVLVFDALKNSLPRCFQRSSPDSMSALIKSGKMCAGIKDSAFVMRPPFRRCVVRTGSRVRRGDPRWTRRRSSCRPRPAALRRWRRSACRRPGRK